MRKGLRSVLIIIILTSAAALFSCPKEGAKSNLKERVETIYFCMDWPTPWQEWILWYYAFSNGYFEREGIKLVIEKPAMPRESLKMIATGWCDMGYAFGMDALKLRAAKKVPITAVAAYFPKNRWGISFFKKDDLQEASDLRFRKVALYGMDTDRVMFKEWSRRNDLSADEFAIIDAGSWSLDSLDKGSADAATTWENCELPFLQKASEGKEFVFSPVEKADIYLTMLVSNENFAQKHPVLLKKFLKAAYLALKDSAANPEAAVDAFYHNAEGAKKWDRQFWLDSWRKCLTLTDLPSMGQINPYYITRALRLLKQEEEIPKEIDDAKHQFFSKQIDMKALLENTGGDE